jgi:hypothetical protein
MAQQTPAGTKQIRVAQYPQLRLIAWNFAADDVLNERDALAIYERNWRFVDVAQLTTDERQFIDYLRDAFGNGVLHV